MPSPLTPTTRTGGWNLDNSYARLPESLYVRLKPVPVRAPRLVLFNDTLAGSLGLDATILASDEGAAIFSGNQVPPGADPLAQAYAGHQFGQFTLLGDGRAILLGEQLTPTGERFDIQLKGSGQTPFSRRGDGRAALGPMLREYLISEAMYALGIPTTRSLAVVMTGEQVFRETPHPGAVLTRVAASHIRVGTFEYCAARGNREEVRTLADYTIQRHFPHLADRENPYQALLQTVMERQAALVADWLHIGFIHGVMNTDNMALSGETIDYGPCAFMDAYDPATVFSSIDHGGRYAYANQPYIAQWNLARFAETLLPLVHNDADQAVAWAEETLATFPTLFRHRRLAGMGAKLGLFSATEEDIPLMDALLTCMYRTKADFTTTFRALARNTMVDAPLAADPEFAVWQQNWQHRLTQQPQSLTEAHALMADHNPAVIPRNHKVEEALVAAVDGGDYTLLHRLLTVLANPYRDPSAEDAAYCQPPQPSSCPYKTFCGT